MAIQINDPRNFTSRRELSYPISGDGVVSFRSYSGVAIVEAAVPVPVTVPHIKLNTTLELLVPDEIANRPGKSWQAEQWTLAMGLAAVSLDNPEGRRNLIALDNWRLASLLGGGFVLRADVVIDGYGNIIHRLFYQLIAIGREVDTPVIN